MSQPAVDTYNTLPQYLASGASTEDQPDEGGIASSEADAYDIDVQDLPDLAEELVQLVTVAEDVLFLGTLREALQELSMGVGLDLNGNIPAEEGGGTGEQGCFSPSSTHYIGFEWWVPINHGNQIQTDSVSFDIGFYTEQCRHNDGSGMTSTPAGE
jgi:hypothetical protein